MSNIGMNYPTKQTIDFIVQREKRAASGRAARGTVLLAELEISQHFRCGQRTGTVLHVGPCGVMVRWSGRTAVEYVAEDQEGGQRVAFAAAGRPIQIGGSTEVMPLATLPEETTR